MVFTFLKARGLGVGSSLVEEDKLELAKELEEKAKEAGVEIILPSDLIVADKFAEDAKTQVRFFFFPAPFFCVKFEICVRVCFIPWECLY